MYTGFCYKNKSGTYLKQVLHDIFLQLSNFYYHCVYKRALGGREAERAERDRWINKERQKIMDSVHGKKPF